MIEIRGNLNYRKGETTNRNSPRESGISSTGKENFKISNRSNYIRLESYKENDESVIEMMDENKSSKPVIEEDMIVRETSKRKVNVDQNDGMTTEAEPIEVVIPSESIQKDNSNTD